MVRHGVLGFVRIECKICAAGQYPHPLCVSFMLCAREMPVCMMAYQARIAMAHYGVALAPHYVFGMGCNYWGAYNSIPHGDTTTDTLIVSKATQGCVCMSLGHCAFVHDVCMVKGTS